jgi:hypothetical protein
MTSSPLHPAPPQVQRSRTDECPAAVFRHPSVGGVLLFIILVVIVVRAPPLRDQRQQPPDMTSRRGVSHGVCPAATSTDDVGHGFLGKKGTADDSAIVDAIVLTAAASPPSCTCLSPRTGRATSGLMRRQIRRRLSGWRGNNGVSLASGRDDSQNRGMVPHGICLTTAA